MKAKAIVKIAICSVVALLLTAILCAALFASERIRNADFDWSTGISSNISYRDADSYTVGSGKVRGELQDMEINWFSGSVTVKAYDGDEICITEPEITEESEQLRFRLENGKLTIQERKSGKINIGLGIHANKSLEVLIPEEQAERLRSMEINSASAEILLEGLRINETEIDLASGNATLKDCNLQTFSIDSASGDCIAENTQIGDFSMDSASGSAHLTGRIDKLEMDAASGSLEAKLENAPREVEFNAASGDCRLTIPKDAAFTAEMDSLSGELSVDGFAVNFRGKTYICGSGDAEYVFNTASGDVLLCAAK